MLRKHNSNMPQSKALDFCLAMSDSLCLSVVSKSKFRWELSKPFIMSVSSNLNLEIQPAIHYLIPAADITLTDLLKGTSPDSQAFPSSLVFIYINIHPTNIMRIHLLLSTANIYWPLCIISRFLQLGGEDCFQFTEAKSSHIPSKWQNLDSNQSCSTTL